MSVHDLKGVGGRNVARARQNHRALYRSAVRGLMIIGGTLLALSCLSCGALGVEANAEGLPGAPGHDGLVAALLVAMLVLLAAGWLCVAWAWTGRRRSR
ncbi:hypothetical protein Drose_30930 [Dactylosporangium roseum]|uniref:Uncharacterized protein n=1 Tax=Dactylosporangium roseum TaxID=47989 RepID=A0ABY5Z0E3_9ACTN|nr:hypothetical protein [Dactylosporangium roseum]UWZ35499.1 hypothetical protein Drose_30930 [Dactylosporangium roseum]